MMKVKILHRYNVSPPANSVPATALPLTFFDIPFFHCCPMQRLFFYDFPQSPLSFAQTTLPLLVRSLSLCLRHFFPFAANLILPLAPPEKPHILYTDGDLLSLIVADSAADFADLVSDEVHDATLIHPLVPQLPPPRESDGALMWPLMAIQVTLFPNKGICIGVQFLHVAADGRSFAHFMKSWASIYRSGGDPNCIESDDLRPFHNRGVIKDPNELELIFLNDWWSCVGTSPSPRPSLSTSPLAVGDKVRATFVFKKAHIDGLKGQISSQLKNDTTNLESDSIHLSTFAVACAFVWVCIIRSKDKDCQCHNQSSSESDRDELRYFVFLADCRDRLEYSIPSTYFGNCLSACFLSEKRSTLLGKSGLPLATRAIARRVEEIRTGGALRGLEGWMRGFNIADSTDLVTVAGSPTHKVYDTNFGWGRLRKNHTSRDGDGGVEVGLALTRVCMEKFISLFEEGLKSFMPL
ncbi:hypothetical protein ACJRO7_034213 [Eucalyptus globulus]|uniref:Uncharacterized protein n=1 Tax=Eucalyptus globulus TaxID=34317 RepID=A0ABD3J5Q5_EUCGL